MPSSDAEMRSYLLGSLLPEREAELKARLRDDMDLEEQLRAVEEELFDQYIAGSLSIDEQQEFESRFLSTARGQQKLRFARVFARYRGSHRSEESVVVDRVPAPNTPVPASVTFFASFHRNPAFAVLMLVVACLLVMLVAWMSAVKSPANDVATQVASPLVEFTLAPGSMRSAGGIQHLTAQPKNVHVKLLLELAKSDFTKYRTQLFRENQALESQEELTTEARNAHYVVPVTVPGEILTPGDYQLKLSGVSQSGQPELIGNYQFRVTAENPAEPADPDSPRDPLAR